MLYFCSDTHFNHKWRFNVSRRQCFASIEHMNESLVANWNNKVSAKDLVYFLGDFGSGKTEDLIQIWDRLKGRKSFVKGNHDTKKFVQALNAETKSDYLELRKSLDKTIILMHYPLQDWNQKWNGALHFHGHCHGRLGFTNSRFDVGVDVCKFAPISLEEILEKIDD